MVRKAHTHNKNHRKRGVTKRRKVKGGNVYATTMQAQRTMEHIVTDVNAVVAQLAELSAELQSSVVPGHPNVDLVALAQAENRQARQQHAPGHANRNVNANRYPNRNPNAYAPINGPGQLRHPYEDGHFWTFQDHNYFREYDNIWDVIGNGRDRRVVWVGVYIPAEDRIDRNVPQQPLLYGD